uniref:FTH domain-containing protein n=1 Tax=Panagrellus redivivus TaxID=6233 RepID=A0A7E4VP06_PANRE
MPDQPTKLQRLDMNVNSLDVIRDLDFKEFFEKQPSGFQMELTIMSLPVHCYPEFETIINRYFIFKCTEEFAHLTVSLDGSSHFINLK